MKLIKLQGDLERRNGLYYEYDADSTPLGEGGMGRVFKGFRVVERTGERIPVAIKAIYDNIPEKVVERARREASIQIDNDNLIRMFGFVETISYSPDGSKYRSHYYVIMELLVGVTLEDVMKGITFNQANIQIPFANELYNQITQDKENAVVHIMKAVLSGLMALHDKGYIHRDIDPSNIMVTIDKKIKLIDFGICKQIVSLESFDKSLTTTGVFMGKVNYAAPELVLGDVKNQNYTTDIYAMGILLYQLYTGHLPFSGTDQDILAANLHTPLPMKDVKSNDFKRVIKKATEKLQSKRYASVAELRVDLEHIQTSNGKGKKEKTVKTITAAICSILIICTLIFIIKGIASEEKVYVPQKSNSELYSDALILIQQKDSIHLQAQGKELLRQLAEDSLYHPAAMLYTKLLINSNDPNNVKRGYEKMLVLAQDTNNTDALFECGLTLSKANDFFNIPSVRQSLIGIEMDIDKANRFLYISMRNNENDYKSVYWLFNNLMEIKLNEQMSREEDDKNTDEIVRLYQVFEDRIDASGDTISKSVKLYRDAIEYDKNTLRLWGLIK